MATAPSKKRRKTAQRQKQVTTLENVAFDRQSVAEPKAHTKMTFRCPVTIENVFCDPKRDEVKLFYESRNGGDGCASFDRLSEAEELAWTESFQNNKVLMGFIVYASLLPSLLRNRIKLNASTYHWTHLEADSERGRLKLDQRRRAAERMKRPGFAQSVFKNLPHKIDATAGVLLALQIDVEEEDERYRFFAMREFSMVHAPRGQVGSSSVYASYSAALSLLWFSTAVLARPPCLESLVLPLSVAERSSMERRFACPSRFFDGPIRNFQTNWGDVFAAVGTHHRNISYTLLENATAGKYVQGLHVSDAYAVFRATRSAPGDTGGIAALIQSYRRNSKHGVESGAVVGVLDVIRDRPAQSVGKIDGGVLGTIASTYGREPCLRVQEQCIGLDQGGPTLFDDSVNSKLGEKLSHFDRELWRARKRDKDERVINAALDPAGMRAKVAGGKMLDPTDPASLELMHTMLKSLSGQVWRPLKSVIERALGASVELPGAFLQITQDEEEKLHAFAAELGVTYTDIANLYTLLLLSFSFQRSQVLRESTVQEYALAPDGNSYRLSFHERKFKTAAAAAREGSGTVPVSHFNLTPDQSMIVKYIATVGHRFCGGARDAGQNRRLLVNAKGDSWTQGDIASRYKTVGLHWLGIPNFGPHVCRSYWASSILNSGDIGSSNIEELSSYLQVSSATLRSSYMSAAAHSAAHTVGSSVLGKVSNMACTGEATPKGERPHGKKLSARRLAFVKEIRASLVEHEGDGKALFRALLRRRSVSRLREGEEWFRWERTFFAEGDERLFGRFLKANVA